MLSRSDYRNDIPADVQGKLRQQVSFRDWRAPFAMGHPDVEVIKHIPYGPAGVRQQLDIYRPRHIPEGGCPVVLQIHGGAWMMGDKGGQALPLMYELASRGWICVAANSRLSPSVSFPTHLHDCKSALCWIREKGSEYGMNTDFVAVTGGSAGGHLTALMGLTANRRELQPGHLHRLVLTGVALGVHAGIADHHDGCRPEGECQHRPAVGFEAAVSRGEQDGDSGQRYDESADLGHPHGFIGEHEVGQHRSRQRDHGRRVQQSPRTYR